MSAPPKFSSAAQTECGDELAISLDISALEVVQQPSATTHHHQQTASAVMIVFVSSEVVCEVVDPLGEERNLNLG